MNSKKFFMGTVIALGICLSACGNGDTAITETNGETAAAAEETTTASETTAAEETTSEESVPEITDPYAAVEKYLEELSESENVTAVELRETRIGQLNTAANKYYESPLAEEFGITENSTLVPVNVEYRIEFAENSGLESGEKSEYFIVDQNPNGFYVIDTFPCDPKDYYGEIKGVLTSERFYSEHYLVELDGGLGTVECINAAFFNGFEAGERILIHANGDIYGEPPRLDAISMVSESEVSENNR